MSLKVKVEGVIWNILRGYSSQVRCELEKDTFFKEMDEAIHSVSKEYSGRLAPL